MHKVRIFAAWGASTVVEDVVLIRLKVPRNEQWVLREFRATSLGMANCEAILRASGVVRARQSNASPQAPVSLSTPVESGEDITMELSNYTAAVVNCVMHLTVDTYA